MFFLVEAARPACLHLRDPEPPLLRRRRALVDATRRIGADLS